MKLLGLFGFLSTNIAIDLGTANTLIYIPNKGVVLNEPTVVALRESHSQGSSMTVGNDAKLMLGRTPENIRAIRPLKDGVIADFVVTEKMLTHFIDKVKAKRFLSKLEVVVCIPCRSTMVERDAIERAVKNSGAKKVYLLEEPMAAAIGAGIPVHDASGSMVVDIGGGTTEIAVIALSGCVYSDSIRVGGDLFDETIINHVRKEHRCVIGETTAEHIKIQVGAALLDGIVPSNSEEESDESKDKQALRKERAKNRKESKDSEIKSVEIRGRDMVEGIPKTLTITSEEIQQALIVPITDIVNSIKVALEKTPPELSSDISERGIVLTGGGALLHNFDKLISRETGLPVTVASDPLTCVSRGGGKALEFVNDKNLDMIFL